MFVMADVTGLGMEAGAFARELWRETGVAVLDAGAFGAAARGWVRIAFTAGEARLEEACRRIVGFARARVPAA
jgi:arginine:pyruvate transaminase